MSYTTDQKICEDNKDFTKCKPKHSKAAKKIALECGTGTGSTTFTSSNDSAFELAHLSINKKCLDKSNVLLKFSSLVNAQVDAGSTVRLKYELFRSCDGKPPSSLGTWIYEKVIESFVSNIKESFGFIFCECEKFNDCCDYFVIVTPLEIINLLPTVDVSVTISDGNIAAIIQDSCNTQEDCLEKHTESESEEIILSCGKGTSAGQAVLNASPPAAVFPPVTTAQVTVDTTCLKKPKVLLEFSSVIGTFNNPFVNLVLQFELFRLCGDTPPVSCGTWAFEKSNPAVSPSLPIESELRSFNFIYCENQSISDCCIYFVTVTALEATPNVTNQPSTWEVCNAQINAYAQSMVNDVDLNHCHKGLENKREADVHNTLHPEPKKAILKCGTSGGSITFSLNLEETSVQLAQVSIDTSNLCKPVVNIEFSSIVRIESPPFVTLINSANLRYELFRVCNKGAPVSLGTWLLDRIPVSDIAVSSETFNFTYCDCITCPGPCDYFVTASPLGVSTASDQRTSVVTVSNGRIAALAQETCQC